MWLISKCLQFPILPTQGNYSYNKIYLENIFFKNFIFVGKYHM
jgi:hypothetical protein